MGKNFSVGNEIEYKCPIGHSLVGEPKRVCQKNGLWSSKAPSCKYIDCGPLPSLEHGSIIASENRTTFGVHVSYVCHENYTLIGKENRTCELDGWTDDQPQCLVDWCPDPPAIIGGKVTVSGRRAGSTVNYECDYGYVLIGSNILSCGLGGEWAGKPPVCRYVDCGTPARPDRGNYILVNQSTTVGALVKYYCDEDYWLDGNGELACLKDGKWSGNTPSCECKKFY